MKKPFFIMLHKPRGNGVTPMTDDDDGIAMFATVEEATEAAHNSDYATAYGWDLFQAGCGIDGQEGIAR